MHGKIVELGEKDNTCVIETQAGKIKFERSSISMELSKSLNTTLKNKKSTLMSAFFILQRF